MTHTDVHKKNYNYTIYCKTNTLIAPFRVHAYENIFKIVNRFHKVIEIWKNMQEKKLYLNSRDCETNKD